MLSSDLRPAPPSPNDFAVVRAAQYGTADGAVALLLAGVSVEAGNKAARVAAECGRADTLRALLATGRVDPAAPMYLPPGLAPPGYPSKSEDVFLLWSAATNGYVDTLAALLEHGKLNPAGDDNHPLRSALRNGHPGCVQLLLDDPRVAPSAAMRVTCKVTPSTEAAWGVFYVHPRVASSLACDMMEHVGASEAAHTAAVAARHAAGLECAWL